MRYKLTESEYSRISELATSAAESWTKQEGEKHIRAIPYVCPDVYGAARNIISEIICTARSASGRVPDKEKQRYFLVMSLGKLRDFIDRESPNQE